MLNRRKQNTGSQAGDEREALLCDAFQGDEYNNQTINIQSMKSASSTQPIYSNNTIQQSVSHSIVHPPVQRKSRDRSSPIESSFRHLNDSYVSKSTKISLPLQQPYDDTYELEVNRNTYSRAIDISCNESYRQQSTDFIYYTLQPGDTLHNLSFKYSCPVASIKRLNNLWSDQEFYGLTKLKLPTGKLRLIADVIDAESVKTNSVNSLIPNPPPDTLNQSTITPKLERFNHLDHKHLDNYDPNQHLISTIESDSIFKDFDLNIEKARSAALCYNDNASAIMQSLVDSGNIVADDDEIDDPNKIACREAEILLNDMSDYGLSYSGLILFIFIVCLVCTLAYVIYLEETHHDSIKAP